MTAVSPFRTPLSETIFHQKYAHEGCETWPALCRTLVEDVCGDILSKGLRDDLVQVMTEMKFIPGGRYLYYAGRTAKYFNNCYLLRAEEDTRADWADLSWKAEMCLMTGGGIGIDYSVYRSAGAPLSRTGGVASGPIPKMMMINEIGRRVMQGGSRRSALYASLNWKHPDAQPLLYAKDWWNQEIPGTTTTLGEVKRVDFDFPAPLDMTNVSLNYDTSWLVDAGWKHPTFLANVRQALFSGEPGFSFNFFGQENETLRNACTEVCSSDDSDVCNLGAVNMARIETIDEFRTVCQLGTVFLLCGTLKAHLPYPKVAKVREKNRRLGLGLMGVHEWLIQRGKRYEMDQELAKWLRVYRDRSDGAALSWAAHLNLSAPTARRAIAPTGTIGMLAGTTTGIEPLFATAYKRRYLKGGRWHYQYAIDTAAQDVIDRYGTDPEKIESALDLAHDYERRIRFQADVQDFVDQCISSTINMPAWGTPGNNEDTVKPFAQTLASYAPRLRGLTCYPDGARGGQPLTRVPYREAHNRQGVEYKEHDICSISGRGGFCGV